MAPEMRMDPRRPRRWITAAAVAVPICVLPSAVWRLGVVVDALSDDPGPCVAGAGLSEVLYLVGLTMGSVGAALLTVGLVRPWGEVFPRWIPIVGGRAVPVRAVTVIATVGAALLAALVGYFVLNRIFGFVEGSLKPVPPGCTPPGPEVLRLYIPLVAWPPLLFLVTFDYYRRLTRVRGAPARRRSGPGR